jgi:purine-nucleoside phosphorylase
VTAYAATVEKIKERVGHRLPKSAIILGSGLQAVAGDVQEAVTFAYAELPGFPKTSVASHRGRLVIGKMQGHTVAVMQGRGHYYEYGKADIMRAPLEVLAALGCTQFVMTAAAQSVKPELGPGQLVLVEDHINFAGTNPLIGQLGDNRFVNMGAAYDPLLRERIQAAAHRAGIPLSTGVFTWFSGPSSETPAEVRAARALGGDMVGKSLVPEVILARFMGLRVVALANVTDWAMGAGPSDANPNLAQQRADFGAIHLRKILGEYFVHGGAD